jgi:hypothetical protein
VPRNVVTVVPRWFPPTERHQRERQRILAQIAERRTPTPHKGGNHLHLDFSKRTDPADAHGQVMAWLDQINPRCKKYVKVYSRARL